MKKIIAPVLVITIAITSLFSCKKDNDTGGSGGKSKTELLTQAPWIQTNDEIAVAGSGAWVPDWITFDACEKDDISTFKTDKTYSVTDGALVCSPSLAHTGTWTISADEKQIITDGYPATIVTLDNNSLVVTSTDGTDDLRQTFKH